MTCQLFRFINITFTTAALGIAIRIRMVERDHDVTGVLGSSPYVTEPSCTCTRKLNPFVI